ncbi:MAG: division/cell wall cluster transcriptional repressor MraZ [Pseudomonadota bacterium]
MSETREIAGGAGRRTKFVGSSTHKIDAKGRVSVPAEFRKTLAGREFDGVYCFPAFTGATLECGGEELIDGLNAMISEMEMFDDDREAFELVVMGETRKLSVDATGRIQLPEEFLTHAELDGSATFVGRGDRFQIWKPETYEAKVADARARAFEARARLGARPAAPSPAKAAE